jgi:hypothetical protein
MGKCWGITKKLRFCKNDAGEKILCLTHESQPKYFLLMVVIIPILISYITGLIPNPWKSPHDQNIDKKLDEIITLNKSLSDAQKKSILQIAERAEEKNLAKLKEKYELGYAILYVDGNDWYYISRDMKEKLDWFSTKIYSVSEDLVVVQVPSFITANNIRVTNFKVGIPRRVGSVVIAAKIDTIEIRIECLEIDANSTTMVVGITQKQQSNVL